MKLLTAPITALAMLASSSVGALETVPATMDGIASDAERIFIGKVVSGSCTSETCSSDLGDDSNLVFVVRCTRLIAGTCEKQELLRSSRIFAPYRAGDNGTDSLCIGCDYLVFVNSDKKFGYIHLFKLTKNNRLIAEDSIVPFKDLQLQRHTDPLEHYNYKFYSVDDVIAKIQKIKSAPR